jgi:hypothetical protein
MGLESTEADNYVYPSLQGQQLKLKQVELDRSRFMRTATEATAIATATAADQFEQHHYPWQDSGHLCEGRETYAVCDQRDRR